MNEPWFEIAKTEEGYEWCLWTGNGRPLAVSAMHYGTVNDCKQAIRTLITRLKNPEEIQLRVASNFLPFQNQPAQETEPPPDAAA